MNRLWKLSISKNLIFKFIRNSTNLILTKFFKNKFFKFFIQ